MQPAGRAQIPETFASEAHMSHRPNITTVSCSCHTPSNQSVGMVAFENPRGLRAILTQKYVCRKHGGDFLIAAPPTDSNISLFTCMRGALRNSDHQ